jgi:transketolase
MRAFEFIRTDVGIPGLPVKFSGFIPGFLSDANGPTHQAVEDVALMRGIPGMVVAAPADEQDMLTMLPGLWAGHYPAYVRVNTRPAGFLHEPFRLGKAEVIRIGTDVTILTYGLLFEQGLVAVDILNKEGLSAGLINMRTLSPVDEEAILAAAAASSRLVTLEDHFITGGLYTIVAEVLLKHRTTAVVQPFALQHKWFRPALLPDVLQYEGFTGKQVAEQVLGYQTVAGQPLITTPAFEE